MNSSDGVDQEETMLPRMVDSSRDDDVGVEKSRSRLEPVLDSTDKTTGLTAITTTKMAEMRPLDHQTVVNATFGHLDQQPTVSIPQHISPVPIAPKHDSFHREEVEEEHEDNTPLILSLLSSSPNSSVAATTTTTTLPDDRTHPILSPPSFVSVPSMPSAPAQQHHQIEREEDGDDNEALVVVAAKHKRHQEEEENIPLAFVTASPPAPPPPPFTMCIPALPVATVPHVVSEPPKAAQMPLESSMGHGSTSMGQSPSWSRPIATARPFVSTFSRSPGLPLPHHAPPHPLHPMSPQFYYTQAPYYYNPPFHGVVPSMASPVTMTSIQETASDYHAQQPSPIPSLQVNEIHEAESNPLRNQPESIQPQDGTVLMGELSLSLIHSRNSSSVEVVSFNLADERASIPSQTLNPSPPSSPSSRTSLSASTSIPTLPSVPSSPSATDAPNTSPNDPALQSNLDQSVLLEPQNLTLYITIYPYTADRNDELTFTEGQVIRVLRMVPGGWWEGQCLEQVGWFPANHVMRYRGSTASPAPVGEGEAVNPAEDQVGPFEDDPAELDRLRGETILFNNKARLPDTPGEDDDEEEGCGRPSDVDSSSLLDNCSLHSVQQDITTVDPTLALRAKIVFDTYLKEKQFAQTLDSFIEEFVEPLASHGGDWLSQDDHDSLFSVLSDLAYLQEDLVGALERCAQQPFTSQGIGQLFADLCPRLVETYTDYVTQLPFSMAIATKYASHPSMMKFLQTTRAKNTSPSILYLISFLHKPMQRKHRYTNILAEIMATTPPDHPDHPHCKLAMVALEELISGVNRTRKQVESREKIQALMHQLDGWGEGPRLDQYGELVLNGTLQVTEFGRLKERTFYLLEKMLVIVRLDRSILMKKEPVYRMVERFIMHKDSIRIIDIGDPTPDVPLSFNLVIGPDWNVSNTIHITAFNPDQKQKWIQALINQLQVNTDLSAFPSTDSSGLSSPTIADVGSAPTAKSKTMRWLSFWSEKIRRKMMIPSAGSSSVATQQNPVRILTSTEVQTDVSEALALQRRLSPEHLDDLMASSATLVATTSSGGPRSISKSIGTDTMYVPAYNINHSSLSPTVSAAVPIAVDLIVASPVPLVAAGSDVPPVLLHDRLRTLDHVPQPDQHLPQQKLLGVDDVDDSHSSMYDLDDVTSFDESKVTYVVMDPTLGVESMPQSEDRPYSSFSFVPSVTGPSHNTNTKATSAGADGVVDTMPGQEQTTVVPQPARTSSSPEEVLARLQERTEAASLPSPLTIIANLQSQVQKMQHQMEMMAKRIEVLEWTCAVQQQDTSSRLPTATLSVKSQASSVTAAALSTPPISTCSSVDFDHLSSPFV